MSKTEETELLGGEQPVSAVIIHTNWKRTVKQTENADPLSPSPNQPLVWTNPVTHPKVWGNSLHTDRADSHTGVWILKGTSSQASLGSSQPTSWAICSRDLRLGWKLLPSTRQSRVDGLSAYNHVCLNQHFVNEGCVGHNSPSQEEKEIWMLSQKQKTNKTKHLVDNKPGNRRYQQALMEIITTLKKTPWKPFPRLQFLSEGQRGTWFVEQELEMVTHKVAHLSATEGYPGLNQLSHTHTKQLKKPDNFFFFNWNKSEGLGGKGSLCKIYI